MSATTRRRRRKFRTLTIAEMHDWHARIEREILEREQISAHRLSRALAFCAQDLSLEQSAGRLRLYAESMYGWALAFCGCGVLRKEPRIECGTEIFQRIDDALERAP